ncbi:MAG: hypothetical protein V2B19_00390 [Pseudomonadota bacterium]
MDLFEEFSQLTSAFKKEKIEYALCGGLAMAVYAFPRATLDIDILIEPETLEKVKFVAKQVGFTFDAGLMKFSGGAIQIYRLTKINPETAETLVLDILLSTPDIKEVWETRLMLAWDQGELPVVSPRGLIKLKSIRLSGQDQDDIKNLERIINENRHESARNNY